MSFSDLGKWTFVTDQVGGGGSPSRSSLQPGSYVLQTQVVCANAASQTPSSRLPPPSPPGFIFPIENQTGSVLICLSCDEEVCEKALLAKTIRNSLVLPHRDATSMKFNSFCLDSDKAWTTTNLPSLRPRVGSTTYYDPGVAGVNHGFLFFFGGLAVHYAEDMTTLPNASFLNDWGYINVAKRELRKLISDGIPPPARSHANLIESRFFCGSRSANKKHEKSSLILFGGWGEEGVCCDIFVWQPKVQNGIILPSGTWTQPELLNGIHPHPRVAGTLTWLSPYDKSSPHKRSLLVFGGASTMGVAQGSSPPPQILEFSLRSEVISLEAVSLTPSLKEKDEKDSGEHFLSSPPPHALSMASKHFPFSELLRLQGNLMKGVQTVICRSLGIGFWPNENHAFMSAAGAAMESAHVFFVGGGWKVLEGNPLKSFRSMSNPGGNFLLCLFQKESLETLRKTLKKAPLAADSSENISSLPADGSLNAGGGDTTGGGEETRVLTHKNKRQHLSEDEEEGGGEFQAKGKKKASGKEKWEVSVEQKAGCRSEEARESEKAGGKEMDEEEEGKYVEEEEEGLEEEEEWLEAEKEEEEDEELFCVCKQPDQGREFMLLCSTCESWIHPGCIGMSLKEFKEQEKKKDALWSCPRCEGVPFQPLIGSKYERQLRTERQGKRRKKTSASFSLAADAAELETGKSSVNASATAFTTTVFSAAEDKASKKDLEVLEHRMLSEFQGAERRVLSEFKAVEQKLLSEITQIIKDEISKGGVKAAAFPSPDTPQLLQSISEIANLRASVSRLEDANKRLESKLAAESTEREREQITAQKEVARLLSEKEAFQKQNVALTEKLEKHNNFIDTVYKSMPK